VILLSVGGLVEGKGHHRVIESLPSILARHPDVLHVIVGDDPGGGRYRRELETLARRHGVTDAVRFAGPRPHDEIPLWLAAADLFCLATRSEGWCNAITEAVASGLPVITTRVGGNAEIVQDGLDGFLVPFWDRERFVSAVLDALDRPWDRAAMARRAGGRGWDGTALAVMEEFRRALSPAGRTLRVAEEARP
jgi:glycosyltransferase involved in cell wall biosynthesis